MKSRHILGALVSLLGVFLIISGGTLAALQRHSLNRGDLLLLMDTVLWGLYSVISRVLTRSRTALLVTAISTWLGVPLLYIAALLEWHAQPSTPNPGLIIQIIYIAVFPTCIGFFAWNEGVRRLGPALSMAFYNLLPVFGVLLSIVFLNEQVTWIHLAGGLLVLAGGLWVIWGRG
jgi:drug/metabolite transporter (DMT)-like permease